MARVIIPSRKDLKVVITIILKSRPHGGVMTLNATYVCPSVDTCPWRPANEKNLVLIVDDNKACRRPWFRGCAPRGGPE